MGRDTIVDRLLERAEAHANEPAVFSKRDDGRWVHLTWGEYAERTRHFAAGLIELGQKEGGSVCILGFNCVEWCIADLATMAAGGAPAGVYTTSSPEEVKYVVEHSESFVLVVENVERWEKQVQPIQHDIPTLKKVVLMHGEAPADDMVLSFAEVEELGRKAGQGALEQRIQAIKPEGLGTLIYTSGTTGPPKAVMLSHASLAFTADQYSRIFDDRDKDVLVSYLPLAHIAEQLASLHVPVSGGCRVYFAESLEKLKDNIAEVRPTVFFAVPRVWEKFYAAMTAKMALATGIKARLLDWARGVGLQVAARRNRGAPLGWWLSKRYALANKLIFSKVKGQIGFDRMKAALCGAAPIRAEIIEFFMSLDITVHEVYGLSENCASSTVNRPGATKVGTAGTAFPGAELKIANDGEILYRGRSTFIGYMKNPAATEEALVDGWLHTGDVGVVDDEGYLQITDRKKDIIITAGGKNISPQNIEDMLKALPLVGHAICIGNQRRYITALLTIDQEKIGEWAKEHGMSGKSTEEVCASDRLKSAIKAGLDGVNERLANVEQVKKYTILPGDFTPESGELTATMKIKRKVVSERFAAQIEAMYE